jgi:hypothetical protein
LGRDYYTMKKLTINELRQIIQFTVRGKTKKKRPSRTLREFRAPRLADLLFEQEEPADEMKPVTIVALYGPPAAGKGAAKGEVGTFLGDEGSENYEDWLEAQGEEGGKYFQEEDEKMVTAMTVTLPPLIFKEIHGRVDAGEDFDTVITDYFHVNETDKRFELSDLLTKGAYEKVLDENTDDTGEVDLEAAAKQFTEFPNTSNYFTQARGFSREIEGADDINAYLGDYPEKVGDQTLGMRAEAASSYLDDVKDELSAMGASDAGNHTYASVYLMDQAGESSADTGRIKQLITLKKESAPGVVTLIGVYIAQPQERTELANLHRAVTGGRRVSSKEVTKIFDAGPKFKDNGDLDMENLGDAVKAMQVGFDQVHVYQPEKPFETDDAGAFADKICAPLGVGKGAFDVEGCHGTDAIAKNAGPKTKARSYDGMEKQAIKDAGLEDEEDFEGGHFPKAKGFKAKHSDAILAALQALGFKDVSQADLDAYLNDVGVPNTRGQDKYGDLPSKSLFGKGTSPTKRTEIPTKSESTRSQKTGDDLIMERWQKLAGLLNDNDS